MTRGRRVLLTNNTLATRAGTELWVRDVALALCARGHDVIAYSPVLGEVAKELAEAGVTVVDDLNRLDVAPDLVHGHHHLETMTALLRFPAVPALFVCHGARPWEEAPPLHPRIGRYVAVDLACEERLIQAGAPSDQIALLLNFVDLARFQSREALDPLPAQPRRALLFSNEATAATFLPVAREACAFAGLPLDVVGCGVGNAIAHPELVLPRYDLVFARARAALEAMAVGAAVILVGKAGTGPLVTTESFDALRPLNFGLKALDRPHDARLLAAEIARYDPQDAAAVSRRVRQEAGLDGAVDALERLHEETLARHLHAPRAAEDEARAAAAYLHTLSLALKGALPAVEARGLEARLAALVEENERLRRDRAATN